MKCLSRGVHQHDRLVIALHIAMVIAEKRGELLREEWTALATYSGSSQPTIMSEKPDWLPEETWLHLHELLAVPSCQVTL